jgi:hypothetical protein
MCVTVGLLLPGTPLPSLPRRYRSSVFSTIVRRRLTPQPPLIFKPPCRGSFPAAPKVTVP